MALTAAEQELYDLAKAQLPRWFFADPANQEMVAGYAKMFAKVRTTAGGWADATYITRAGAPWLDEHARDRGTRRQTNESDAALAARLRTIDDAVSPNALLDAVNAILVAAGITTSAALVELRPDRAFFGFEASLAAAASVQGAGGAATWCYRVAAQLATGAVVSRVAQVTAGNATLTGTNFNRVTWTDVAGGTKYHVFRTLSGGTPSTLGKIGEVNAGVQQLDDTGLAGDGRLPFEGAYLTRGYRMGVSGRPHVIIVILPFGTLATLEPVISEAVRQKKAGGVVHRIEIRGVP